MLGGYLAENVLPIHAVRTELDCLLTRRLAVLLLGDALPDYAGDFSRLFPLLVGVAETDFLEESHLLPCATDDL